MAQSESAPSKHARRRLIVWCAPWFAIASLVVLVDQLSKRAIISRFADGERLALIAGWFDLTLVYNRGAAFSFLAGAAGWQRWFFTSLGLGAALFMAYLIARHAGQRLFAFALTLIIGGALGNVIDRVEYGKVVDFLLAYHDGWFFPAFNLADSAITIGAVLLLVDELLRYRRRRE